MTTVIDAFGVSDLWPTPPALARKMLAKIKLEHGLHAHHMKVLEPSAGKGDLIEAICKGSEYDRGTFENVSAIEIDPDLRAALIGKGVKVIDTDFLMFAGPDKFDIIIMNPPFREGDRHLLKAIDIMYSGQIICLLNAETICNPHTNIRKMLVDKLTELGAEIEYLQGEFK
ncbi:MAG: methyltransferase, partial [Desulfatirhabdiaceae bacterium]